MGSTAFLDPTSTPRHNPVYRSKNRKSSGHGSGPVQNVLRHVGSMLMGVLLGGRDPREDVAQFQQEQARLQQQQYHFYSGGGSAGSTEWFNTYHPGTSRRVQGAGVASGRLWAPSHSFDDPYSSQMLQHQSSVSTPSSVVSSPFRQNNVPSTLGRRKESQSGVDPAWHSHGLPGVSGPTSVSMSQPSSYNERLAYRASPAPSSNSSKAATPHKNSKGIPQPTPNYKSYVKTPVSERKKRMGGGHTPQQHQAPHPVAMHQRAHSYTEWNSHQQAESPVKQGAFPPTLPHASPNPVTAVSNPSYEHYNFPLGHAPVNGPPQRPLTLDIRHPEGHPGGATSNATPDTPAESGISTGGSSCCYRSFPASADASTTSAPFGGSHLLDLPSDGQPCDRTPPLVQFDVGTPYRPGGAPPGAKLASRRAPLSEDSERDFAAHPLSPVESSP